MNLPPPINGTESYLAAIHAVLGEIRDRLPEQQPQPVTDQVELREPQAPAATEPAPSPEAASAAEPEPLTEPAPAPTRGRRRTTKKKEGDA